MFALLFVKHKTAYEMRISDWSSDVGSSDLDSARCPPPGRTSAPPCRARARCVLLPAFFFGAAGHDGSVAQPCLLQRPEERRGGEECVSKCRFRWSQHH